MEKVITIKVPKWIKERELIELVNKYIEIKKRELEIVDDFLREKGLDKEDLKRFEKFRGEYWEKKGEDYLLS